MNELYHQFGLQTVKATRPTFVALLRWQWERQLGMDVVAKVIDQGEHVTLHNGTVVHLHSSGN